MNALSRSGVTLSAICLRCVCTHGQGGGRGCHRPRCASHVTYTGGLHTRPPPPPPPTSRTRTRTRARTPTQTPTSVRCLQAVFRAIVAAAAAKPALLERLCSGVLLTGPGAALRGLGPVLERRLMARFSRVGRAQAVSVLEIGGGDPRSTAWRGGALLGALDAGRESWLLREQWVAPGAASARHTRLVFYLRAEQGLAVS